MPKSTADNMIDLHTHTLHSDGALLPSELAARAAAMGYSVLAVTDHVDISNIEDVAKKTIEFAASYNDSGSLLKIIPGVEITHVQPSDIAGIVKKARALGVKLIVLHGETIVEPVTEGTNRAAILSGIDILAHPGLITDEECELAKENNVALEITTRRGHSLTNGHVALMAKRHDNTLVLSTDAHAPGDLVSVEFARKVAMGAGIYDFKGLVDNAKELIEGL
jgi:histidinol phosphatase-like PHP family hydrolase